MQSPLDSTEVFRMRKDFDTFISGRRRKIEQPSFRLNLDADDSHDGLPTATDVSIKALLEKEKQEKLRIAELLAARSKIVELEIQLSSTKTSCKRARIEFEKDLDSVRFERERESERISELRSKIRQLTESEQLVKTEFAESRREWERARIKLEKKLRNAQHEKFSLEEDVTKVKEDCWEKLLEQQQELALCQNKLEVALLEMEEKREEMLIEKSTREETLAEKMKDYENLQKAIDNAAIKMEGMQEQMSRQAEDAAVTRAMRADIDRVPTLEMEVNRLRTENDYLSQQKQNVMLLQEQVTSMQKKLEAAEERCQTMAQVQVEHEDLKARLQRWEAADASGSIRPQSPSELTKRVKELQAAEALALDQKGQLQSSIATLELQLREAAEQQRKSQGELTAQQIQMDRHSDLIKRLKRKLLLVTKERDSFKRILDSYESEMTVPISADSRAKSLEEVLQGYQQHCQELEVQVENLTQRQQQAQDRCLQLEQQVQTGQFGSSASLRVDQDKICHLQERLLTVEQELKKVSEEKEVLEMRIEQRNLQGDYDPRVTKVVHFSMNPAAVAQQQRERELQCLKEDNERLTTRVQLLERAGGRVDDLTMQVDQCLETVPESKVINELKLQLSKEELRNQRLVEAFKKTSQEFRETCYQLLGYKIDMPRTGEYRLSSMYSDSSHDYMLFKQGPSGEIQMLATDFSSRQQDKLEMYLQNRDSIPALLSAITLELFGQQTLNME